MKRKHFPCFSWRLCLQVLLTFALALVAVAQNKRPSDAASYGLSGENIPPWHLKVNCEVFDRLGNIRDWGTDEEFWVCAKRFKRIYSSMQFSTVLYGTDKGILRSGNPGLPSLPLEELRRAIITPVDAGTAMSEEPVTFYGHLLRRKIVIEHAGRKALAARIVSIEALTETGADFRPPADASPQGIPLLDAIIGSNHGGQGRYPM